MSETFEELVSQIETAEAAGNPWPSIRDEIILSSPAIRPMLEGIIRFRAPKLNHHLDDIVSDAHLFFTNRLMNHIPDVTSWDGFLKSRLSWSVRDAVASHVNHEPQPAQIAEYYQRTQLEDAGRPSHPADEIIRAELKAFIREAIRGFPTKAQENLVRFVLQGMAPAEIAAERGVSRATISESLSRWYQILEQKVDEWLRGQDP